MNSFEKSSKILAIAPGLIQSSFKKATFEPQPIEPGFYRKIRKNILFYRIVFLSLGIIFAYLSGMLLFKTPSWTFKLIFDQEFSFKFLLVSISLLFGVASLWIGCSLRTSHEAIYSLVRHQKRRLKMAYYSLPKSKIHDKRYELAKQEMEMLRDKALAKIEMIEESAQKDSLKLSQIIALLTHEKKRLSAIIDTFTAYQSS